MISLVYQRLFVAIGTILFVTVLILPMLVVPIANGLRQAVRYLQKLCFSIGANTYQRHGHGKHRRSVDQFTCSDSAA